MKSPAAFREASRRRERLEKRLSRAAFRLEMAELERTWAIVSANREGWSVREIAKKVALGPTRVHQLVSSPEADFAEHALSALREAGWPSPEDPLPDQEELVADRLTEEAVMLVSCAKWLEELAAGQRPVVNLRPIEDWPDSNHVLVDHGRVIRVLRRIAADIDELARSRRTADLTSKATDTDPRLRLRRLFCEPEIERPKARPNLHREQMAWEEYERQLKRAGLPAPKNPYRHLDCSPK